MGVRAQVLARLLGLGSVAVPAALNPPEGVPASALQLTPPRPAMPRRAAAVTPQIAPAAGYKLVRS